MTITTILTLQANYHSKHLHVVGLSGYLSTPPLTNMRCTIMTQIF